MKIINAHVEMHVLGDVTEKDVSSAVTDALDELVFDLGLNVVEFSSVNVDINDDCEEDEDDE